MLEQQELEICQVLSNDTARKRNSKKETKRQKLKNMKNRIDSVRKKFQELEMNQEEDRQLFLKLVGVSEKIELKANDNIVKCQKIGINAKNNSSFSKKKMDETQSSQRQRASVSEGKIKKAQNFKSQVIKKKAIPKEIKKAVTKKQGIQTYIISLIIGVALILFLSTLQS